MKKKTITTLLMLLIVISIKAQFQSDGSFHAGSFFKLTPSGRVNGNLIFSKPTDQNAGIIRGSDLGMEFLTNLSGTWYQRMTVTPDGKVGVATTDPGGHSAASEDLKFQVNGDMAVNRGYMLSIDHSWQTHGYLKYDDAISGARFKHHGYYGHRFDDNGGTRMVILQGGDVGIGTTSPSDKLEISKNGGGLDITHSNSSSYSSIEAFESTSSQAAIQFLGSSFVTSDRRNAVEIVNRKVTGNIDFYTENAFSIPKVRINSSGKVGIGTTTFGSHKLAVEGSIGAREVKVEASGWSDFVFEKDYELRTLAEVEEHINKKGHLPEIPSESEVTENGINLGEMDAKLLQKIEELTLYMIQMNKELTELKTKNKRLEEEVTTLKKE